MADHPDATDSPWAHGVDPRVTTNNLTDHHTFQLITLPIQYDPLTHEPLPEIPLEIPPHPWDTFTPMTTESRNDAYSKCLKLMDIRKRMKEHKLRCLEDVMVASRNCARTTRSDHGQQRLHETLLALGKAEAMFHRAELMVKDMFEKLKMYEATPGFDFAPAVFNPEGHLSGDWHVREFELLSRIEPKACRRPGNLETVNYPFTPMVAPPHVAQHWPLGKLTL